MDDLKLERIGDRVVRLRSGDYDIRMAALFPDGWHLNLHIGYGDFNTPLSDVAQRLEALLGSADLRPPGT